MALYNQESLGSVDNSLPAYVPRLVPERSTRNENLYVPRFMRGIQTNGPS